MPKNVAALQLRVAEVEACCDGVRAFRLRAAQGDGSLPGFTAGAHVNVQVVLADGTQDWRRYSLVNLDPAAGATDAPAEYRIAVRLESGGRGGSRYMHECLHAGATLWVEPPRNDFALHPHGGRAVLIGGGIGVTPMASMAAHCRATGRPVTLHFAGRSRAALPLLQALSALLGDDLHVHADDEAGAHLDIGAILDRCGPSDAVYVCGPQPMLDAVLAQAAARGWPQHRVHFELFAAPAAAAGDHAFDLVLADSGRTLRVPADRSVLAVLNDAGCDLMFDCERGECGVCAVEVVEGEIDHRDYVLTAAEKAAGSVMHTCVSRCKGERLVLKL